MVSVKDVLKLSAAIYEKTGLPFGNVAGLAADAFLNDSDDGDDGDEEKKWRRGQVDTWWDMYVDLMDAPMSEESKRRTAMGQIRSDYIRHFGGKPKERWVEKLHADLVMGVKGDMAYTGDDAPEKD